MSADTKTPSKTTGYGLFIIAVLALLVVLLAWPFIGILRSAFGAAF